MPYFCASSLNNPQRASARLRLFRSGPRKFVISEHFLNPKTNCQQIQPNDQKRGVPLTFKSLMLFAGFLTVIPLKNVHPSPNVWDVLRHEFTLNHETTQPEVQQQIRWIASHPSYIQKLARQSEPYIYHIVTEIKKRHLPGEIALIPMIESSFDPFAYSGMGAAGLWQLMPGTGTDLGLKQDWWYDGRRSIGPSTNAALSYLSYLNQFFNGDWILAFAAYDAGEGSLARTIKNSGQTGHKIYFWSLNVPAETRAYIPRLLALAEIIQNPSRYKVDLPDIPHAPYFEEVNIGSQIDLNHAAKLAGMSYRELIKLNPGFNRWATAPYRPYKLLIPTDKVEDFNRNLAHVPIDERVSWTRHKVSVSDNLILIAAKYHTTVNLIKELNQLKTNNVKKGQFVLIPSSKNTVITTKQSKTSQPTVVIGSHVKVLHIVQDNESLPYLEQKYKVTARDIQTWNHLNPKTALKKGQQLTIWRRSQPTGTYVVQPGDTLSGIAKRTHTTLSALLQRNPSMKEHLLRVGQMIALG